MAPICEIEKTASSIFTQAGSQINVEWVLVVGKYFDQYKEYFKRFPEIKYVKLHFQEPTGIYSAMNFGMSKALGDWIWFVNCGDYLIDSKVLEKVSKLFIDNPENDFFASPVLYATPQGDWFDISWPKILESNLNREAHVHHQGALLRKTICDRVDGGFDTNLKFAADGKFLDIAATRANIFIVESVLVVFVMGGASSKNYSSTVREAVLYRKSTKINISAVIKNWARETILTLLNHRLPSFLIHPFIRLRSRKIKKLISSQTIYLE